MNTDQDEHAIKSQERPERTLKDMISSEAMQKQFAAALPKHLSPERFVRIAITALSRSPKLMECEPKSLMKCLLDLSSMGLEPDGYRAHLIPFRNNKLSITECTLIVDYKGLVELAKRSGNVATIHADKVCEEDFFEVDRGEIKAHRINYRKPRGNAFAYYCLIKNKDGTEKSEVMDCAQIEDVRARSKSRNDGPWVTDYDEMAKKTVFRRACKWIELSPEIRDTLDAEEDREWPRNVTPKSESALRIEPVNPFYQIETQKQEEKDAENP